MGSTWVRHRYDGAVTLATYTVLLGSYESLNEQEGLAERGDGAFYCFTDNRQLTSTFWDVHQVEPALPSDPVRSQRLLKIVGHELLRPFDTTFYLDNSVALKRPPSELVADWLADPSLDIALPLHSYRESILDEFDELLNGHYDDPARLYEQLVHYAHDHPDSLTKRPYWTAMLARRRSERLDSAMSTWATHVLRYSRRDQLSARHVLDESGLSVNAIEIENFESPWHTWPIPLHRRVSQGRSTGRAAGPLIADLRSAERRAREAEQAKFEAEVTLAEAQGELDRLQHYLWEREDYVKELLANKDSEIESIHNSTTWRLASRLQKLLRRRK